MPNRIIKESINESRGLTSCSFFAQDLYKRLITYADDYGRFNADPQIMVARLYPRELAVVSAEDLMEGLIELTGVGKICFYTSKPRNEVYGAFPNWKEHQRVRDSKKRNPDPDNTEVNDWYYRRFIPISMKKAVIERDGFKCQICGKHIAEVQNAEKLIKMGTGMFHFDHIVPCQQGGRATMENLRLTCPKCNLTRQRSFSYDEILQFAETCGNSRRNSETGGLNPIQSESESNPNPYPNPTAATAETPFGTVTIDPLIVKVQKELNGLTDTHYQRLEDFRGFLGDDLVSFAIDAAVGNGVRNWNYVEAILKGYEKDGIKTVGEAKARAEKRNRDKPYRDSPGKVLNAQKFSQREYSEDELKSGTDDQILSEILKARQGTA